MSTGALGHRGEAVRNALLNATSDLLVERGPDVTLEDIAERAEVGRRTIFRYFETKDHLIAHTIARFFRDLAARVPTREGRPLEAWLYDVARTIHEQNLRIAPAFIDGARRRREVPGVSMFLDRPGRRRFHQRMEALAQEAWLARHGDGAVPQPVAESFTLHLSVFASEALRLHCRLDAHRMADLTVDTLLALLDEHLRRPKDRIRAQTRSGSTRSHRRRD
jgi:AcrR family transcriptional regulator